MGRFSCLFILACAAWAQTIGFDSAKAGSVPPKGRFPLSAVARARQQAPSSDSPLRSFAPTRVSFPAPPAAPGSAKTGAAPAAKGSLAAQVGGLACGRENVTGLAGARRRVVRSPSRQNGPEPARYRLPRVRSRPASCASPAGREDVTSLSRARRRVVRCRAKPASFGAASRTAILPRAFFSCRKVSENLSVSC
jgi:hypothetical protein